MVDLTRMNIDDSSRCTSLPVKFTIMTEIVQLTWDVLDKAKSSNRSCRSYFEPIGYVRKRTLRLNYGGFD
jgi:hypothetical protein